nr:hypothetical protein GCM10020093_116350 [Planobispora longispora]
MELGPLERGETDESLHRAEEEVLAGQPDAPVRLGAQELRRVLGYGEQESGAGQRGGQPEEDVLRRPRTRPSSTTLVSQATSTGSPAETTVKAV